MLSLFGLSCGFVVYSLLLLVSMFSNFWKNQQMIDGHFYQIHALVVSVVYVYLSILIPCFSLPFLDGLNSWILELCCIFFLFFCSAVNYIVLPHFIMQTSVPKNVFIRRSTHLLTNGESNLQIYNMLCYYSYKWGQRGECIYGWGCGVLGAFHRLAIERDNIWHWKLLIGFLVRFWVKIAEMYVFGTFSKESWNRHLHYDRPMMCFSL